MYGSEDTGDKPPNQGSMLAPDAMVARLCDVPIADLLARGIQGIILDLDNTLVGFGLDEPDEPCGAWVREATAAGLRIVLLSNNFPDRVARVAGALGIGGIPNALKPLPFGFSRALAHLALPGRVVAVVGDQLFTDMLGGKLFGCYTVLTEPIEHRDFPLTRVFRFFERFVLAHRRSS